LALLLIFAMIVALGIKLVGTLLMGALTVIPTAVAKNASLSMRGYIVLSALLGGAISIGGMWMAEAFRFLPGPSIILFGVGLFLLSLAFGRGRAE
jgi:zinc transport system permease protein